MISPLLFLFSYRLFSTQWQRVILLNANQFMTLPTQNPISLRAIAKIQHDLFAVIPQTPLNTPPLCHSPETHLPPNCSSNVFCTLSLMSSSWNALPPDVLLFPLHNSFKSLPVYLPFSISLSDHSPIPQTTLTPYTPDATYPA